jgi:ABC-type nitrate/sulfonate/bicarbonate transport system substrate-binding protein
MSRLLWKAVVLGLAAAALAAGWNVARHRPTVEVRMAVPERMRSAAIYVAMDKGYFADQDLKVIITPVGIGKDALARTLAGEFDMAAVAGLPVVTAIAEGADVAILTSLAQSERHVAIVTTKAAGATIAELRGKSIGILPSTTSELFLNTMLDSAGMTADEVKAVPLKPDEFIEAIPSGKVDAVSAWDPIIAKVRDRLGDGGIAIRNNGAFVDYWLLTASGPWLPAHRDVAERVLRALVAAGESIGRNPDEARAIAARWIPKDAEAWDPSIYMVRLDSAMPRILQSVVRIGLRRGWLPALDAAIRPEPLRAVAPTAVTMER